MVLIPAHLWQQVVPVAPPTMPQKMNSSTASQHLHTGDQAPIIRLFMGEITPEPLHGTINIICLDSLRIASCFVGETLPLRILKFLTGRNYV